MRLNDEGNETEQVIYEQQDTRLAGYSVLPNWVLESSDYTTNEKMTMLSLSRFEGATGGVWPSHRTLARISGLSVSTVKRSLASLRDKGMLGWTEQRSGDDQRKTSNLYVLLFRRGSH